MPQAAPSDSSSGTSGTASPGTGSTMGSSTQSGSSATTPTASAGDVVTEQQDGQTLSSDLIGMKVVGSNQESIGKVSALIIENDQVVGAVLDVGGFLGLGAKKVGVPWNTLSVSETDGSMVANVTLSKEELSDMPEFKTIADAKAEQSRQPATGTTSGTVGGAKSTN
jgi:sporulation protein YlmC with PRC-barrel domain